MFNMDALAFNLISIALFFGGMWVVVYTAVKAAIRASRRDEERRTTTL